MKRSHFAVQLVSGASTDLFSWQRLLVVLGLSSCLTGCGRPEEPSVTAAAGGASETAIHDKPVSGRFIGLTTGYSSSPSSTPPTQP